MSQSSKRSKLLDKINQRGDKQTQSNDIDTGIDNKKAILNTYSDLPEGRENIPESGGGKDPEPTVPESGGGKDPEPTVPESGGDKDPEPTVPESGSDKDPEPTVPESGGDKDPEPTVPESGGGAPRANGSSNNAQNNGFDFVNIATDIVEESKRRLTMEETHRKVTFWVPNELAERFDKIARKNKDAKGFKSKTVQRLLESFCSAVESQQRRR